MRFLVIWLVGCSYTSTPIIGASGDAPMADQAVSIDMPVDMPVVSATCIAHATSTSPAGHHYFATADGTFDKSQAECVQFEGHLVKIEDATEDAFVTGIAGGQFTWIGLEDPNNLDLYQWRDATPLLPGAYNGFPGGTIPANASSNCVDSNGSWDVFGCGATNHGGVCECE